MGRINAVRPVKLFCGIIGESDAIMGEARALLESTFGPVETSGGPFVFDDTDYYKEEMGPNLLRTFVSFRGWVDPAELAETKVTANGLEERLSASEGGVVKRRVNLDPGYLGLGKIVLATTKDQYHRIYLGRGIYGEVTLRYRKGLWTPFEWTYPDYRSGKYKAFFDEVRQRLVSETDKRRGAGARRAPPGA
ncbi:MAG: DUF4416 family protein [Kiritimatiellia bacterium]